MGTGTNLFVRIFANVDSALSTYITDTVGNVIGYASPLFTSMMIVWIAMWGILMMFAKVDEPVRDGVFRIIRIGGIVALGLTVGTYMDVVVNVLQKGPNTFQRWFPVQREQQPTRWMRSLPKYSMWPKLHGIRAGS